MSTETTKIAQKSPFFINRNYGLLWSGQAISSLGDTVFDTTLILWIASFIGQRQQWAPLAVSGVIFAAALPMLLVAPFAGVFVDRWDKRRTMLHMDAIRATLILLLLLAISPLPFLLRGQLPVFGQLALIYTVVFLASTCAQLFNPARLTLIGDIVEEPERTRASGLTQITTNISIIAGPVIAATLLFTVGIQWALIINALSFMVSFLTILAIQVSEQSGSTTAKGHFWSEFTAGLHYFKQNRILTTLLISLIIATMGISSLNALEVFFVIQNLHMPAGLYAALIMAFGIGSIVGAMFAPLFTTRLGTVRSYWLGLLLVGLLLLIFARQNSLVPALCIMFLQGFPFAAMHTAFQPLLLHITPRELLGRVFSVFSPFTSLAALLSSLLAGYLASSLLLHFHTTIQGITFGPIDTILLGTGVLVSLAGLYAMLNLRTVHIDFKQPSEKTA